MSFVSDSGHWYDREGKPCYTIIGKNGKERPTTVRDAREHGFVPSVTEILKILAKPGLERWKLEQVKLAALTLPQIKNETLDQFSARISHDANKQSIDARDLGTSIHAQIERYFQGSTVTQYADIVYSLAETLNQSFPDQIWYSEHSFSHPFGYGGKIDLYSEDWVIDYKTKDFCADDMKKTFSYDEHILQLSAYRHGLILPDSNIANVFISRNNPGLIKVEKHKKNLTEQFLALLNYWQISKKFDSSY